jgi:type I site-specific restriction-modification system R (restriction) subunit
MAQPSAVWNSVPIENLCTRITSGGTPLRSNRSFYEGGSIPWVKTGELHDWFVEDTEEKITPEAIEHSSAKLFPKNTILMAMYGDGRTITSLGILRREAASNQACCALIVNDKVCRPLFLFYSLKEHRRSLLKLAYGGAQRNLNAKTIRNFEVPVPPLAEQARIEAILSAYDNLIENNTRRIKILEQMAQMLYREWFVNFRFPGYEKVKMVGSEIGLIPQGWNPYPKLSDRSDIIVITDEAHRSQYDIFALNMRNALPNAAFIGFTGTPLMAGEERTKQVFGDYVSIYNFKQSTDDKNTVPLYYENRIPELQLVNENLFSHQHGVELDKILKAAGFEREKLKDDAVAAFVLTDDIRRQFLGLVGDVEKLFKSLLPDPAANQFGAMSKMLVVIAEKIRSEIGVADISGIMEQVGDLLDESIATEGYVIRPSAVEANYIDLSKIDFDLLRQQFNTGRKAIEAQKLRTQIAVKVAKMVQLNKTRMNFLEEFQRMIDEYNSGAANIETFFARLMAFTQKLSEEDKRAISEELTEEELTIFDLLTKPDPVLTKAEERDVKKVAKELLKKLKSEKLVLDWKKRQATRAAVRYTIETVLDELPRTYTPDIYDKKCDVVYQHVFDSYTGMGGGLYAA